MVLLQQRSLRSPMISLSVSHRLDIKAVKKVVASYGQVAETKINFGKCVGLRLGIWRGSVLSQGPSARVTDLSASSGCGSDPASNWSEIGRRYRLGRYPSWYLASKAVVLKEQVGVRRVHLPLHPLPLVCTSSVQESSASASTINPQITLGRPNADGSSTGLLSTSA